MNSMVHRVPYSELLAANNLDSFWIVKLNIKEHEILHTVTRRPEVTDPRLNFQEHYPKTKINKMIFLPKNGSSLLSLFTFSSVQFSSVAQLCPTLCDPMNCSTPGLPVQHQLPEFTQTHVHRVGDAIQPSHPLSSPSPPAPKSLPA